MKKVLYLALAVVATAFATSCVKELADGNQENTGNKHEIEITGQVFEAKMEATKSVIDGKTPTWVEGDAISVFGSNETTGIECTFAGEGKFQVNGDKVVEGPFYAIYPHKEGHTVDQSTGIFTATVPAEQLIKAGENTAAGALVAVAASETPEFYFRNAVGLVRLENKREDIVSIKIESTNAEQMLAGSFTMDLNPDKDAENEAPAVTPATEGGSASVTLKSAEENGVLASGVYYAAILPGKIDGIKVTFTRKNGEKTETATVTKQQAATIERNGGANLGAFFSYEIKNAQELLAWNKACAKWTDWDVVKLMADIDCSEDPKISTDWKVSEKVFEGTFDGNNKTIKNFVIEREGPAAFFGVANNAYIKNLTFDAGCSFTSKGYTIKEGIWVTADRQYAACLICESKGATVLENIINYGSVSATTASASNGNYLGGICAYLDSTEDVSNCINHGTITYSANTTSSWVNVSGCFGQITKDVALNGCENHGKVQFTGTNSGNKSLNLAGIAGGCMNLTLKNCKNLGSINCNAAAKNSGGTNIGGLIGLVNSNVTLTFENCANGSETDNTLGSLTNISESGTRLSIGGCVGYITGSAASDKSPGFMSKAGVSNFKNYGAITNNGVSTSTVSMGGVLGQIDLADGSVVTSCENHGNITHSKADMDKMTLHMGGIIGFINKSSMTIGDITKMTEDVKNYGKIQSSKKSVQFGLGGIVGRIYCADRDIKVTIQNCLNETNATVSYAGWWASGTNCGLGGTLGVLAADKANKIELTINKCANKAPIQKTGQGLQSNFHVGGIVGGLSLVSGGAATKTTFKTNITNCTNTGAVSNTDGNYGRSGNYSYCGGIAGHFGSEGVVSDCVNRGTVTHSIFSKTDGAMRMGGITGNADNTTYTNCQNYGTVKDASKAYQTDLGGIIGRANASNIKITGCSNFGDIVSANTSTETTYKDKNDKTCYYWIAAGGIVGRGNAAGISFSDCHCAEDCTLENTNTAGKEILGGLIGYGAQKNTLTTCSSKATITNSNASAIRSGVFGGTWVAGFTITGCSAGGKYGDTVLDSSNYKTYAFGSGSTFKDTANITFAE